MAGVDPWNKIGPSKPTTKQLSRYVIPRVAAKWHELGIELYKDNDILHLDRIGKEHPGDFTKACTEMFKFWRTTYTNATWNKLIKAITAPGLQLNAIAADIKRDLVAAPADDDSDDDSGPSGPSAVEKSSSAPAVDKLSEKPEMADLNKIVVKKVMIHWEELAEGFRYDDQVIANIKLKNRENPEECCRTFFRDWRGTDNGNRAGPKTWSTLFNVIEEYTSIARDIREEMIAQVKKLS